MGRSWKLGTVFGIGIYVHWTFFLLLGLILYLNRSAGPQGALFAAGFLLSLYFCVLLHELGHALMARYYGIPTRDITMLPIGGVARLERMSERPWEEFCIAVAGPAVNVVIAAALLVGMLLFMRMSPEAFAALVPNTQAEIGEKLAQHGFRMFVVLLMWTNVSLVIFNMIPAFPMDGGRVFRAILSSFVGFRPATEVAAVVGMVVAVLLALLGIQVLVTTWNPLPMLVSMFVLFAGQQELLVVRYRDALRKAPPIDVLPANAPWPPPPTRMPFLEPPAPLVLPVQPFPPPPEPGFSGFTWDRGLAAWIEWREGRPVAINGQYGRIHGGYGTVS